VTQRHGFESSKVEWIEAYLATDTDRFAALLHEEFVYSSERGVFRKDEHVANLGSGEIEMRGLENEDVEVIDHGPIAISIGVSRLDASFHGEDISGRDRSTRVWKREESKWTAVALHANATPEE
jgi:ketosteroid isomerase-like protein